MQNTINVHFNVFSESECTHGAGIKRNSASRIPGAASGPLLSIATVPKGSLALDFWCHRDGFPVCELFINEIMQWLLFLCLLLLLRFMSVTCTLVQRVVVDYFILTKIYYTTIYFFILLLGLWVISSSLVNVESAAINILIQIFWCSCACLFFGFL